MDFANLPMAAYIGAAVLFILSLGGLSHQETARRGNLYGMIGMAVAIVATVLLLDGAPMGYILVIACVAIGGFIGARWAMVVEMTQMPELVAALHSFVGLAAVLVGVSFYLGMDADHSSTVHQIEIYVDVALGSITFTGSVIAWAKLKGRMSGTPLLLPARHFVNLGLVFSIVMFAKPMLEANGGGVIWLLVMAVLAGLLGVHLVMAIGGADMPVVVSLLNSYSGWTAAAAGFMLSNDLLIVTGALVGSSGAILSYIMCKAMNRSIWNVAFGGFGTDSGKSGGPAKEYVGEVTAIEADGVADLVRDAKSIVVVPGYGMAVAQAQHTVNELSEFCRDAGKEFRFAIHPVAGRLPGHMNVLLAEAGVSYDIVLEMDEINDDLSDTDVVLVIGANGVANPGALGEESSPMWGRPVLHVWGSGTVVVCKRSLASGYAGVGNPLFIRDNTRMLFGDAKVTMQALLTALRS